MIALTSALLTVPNALNARNIDCSAKSGESRVALLELYTSEGCDSCPPADRWLSAFPDKGLGFDKVAPIALHVDYWNYLGWTDRFSQPQFTQRQRAIAARNRSSTIYTPQRILNGRDFRAPLLGDETPNRVSQINRSAPGAEIALRVTGTVPQINVRVSVTAAPNAASAELDSYVALVENGLESSVTRGENRGKRLRHDYVLRSLIGPLPLGTNREQQLTIPLTLRSEAKTEQSALIAFVENRKSGDVLQALATPLCKN